MMPTLRRILRWLPFLLPPLALALIIWLQPEDHMGAYPDRAPWVGKLVYDDWDWSAVVLRGLNASLGRKAGLAEEPHPTDAELCDGLDDPDRPLADRYFLEYPEVATWFFRVPYLMHPVDVPSIVCDGHYGNIIFHRPRNDAERDLWRTFRRVMQEYAAFMAVCLLMLMLLVHVGYGPDGELSGPVWLLVLPGALYFTLNRFDVLPALLTAMSLTCLGRRWLIASAFFLATATLVKVYPVLLAPLIFRYFWNERRAAVTWAAAYGLSAGGLLLAAILATDWQSVVAPYQVQLARLPMGPTAYGVIVPMDLGENDARGRGFRFGTLGLLMILLLATRPPDLASVLRRGAVAVIVFANLSVFYSPQWILWFSPLLVPLAGRHWSVLLLVVALDLVTYLTFPVVMLESYASWPLLADFYHETLRGAWAELSTGLVLARFAILGALIVALTGPEIRGAPGGRRCPDCAPR
jgi:hypothetical protein